MTCVRRGLFACDSIACTQVTIARDVKREAVSHMAKQRQMRQFGNARVVSTALSLVRTSARWNSLACMCACMCALCWMRRVFLPLCRRVRSRAAMGVTWY